MRRNYATQNHTHLENITSLALRSLLVANHFGDLRLRQ